MTTAERLEKAFKVVAFAKLTETKQPLLLESIENEASRIERCCEYHYKTEDHDYQWQTYVTLFLQERYKDLIYNTIYDGQYIDDIPQPVKPRTTVIFDYTARVAEPIIRKEAEIIDEENDHV